MLDKLIIVIYVHVVGLALGLELISRIIIELVRMNTDKQRKQMRTTEQARVRTGPGNPGKSLILKIKYPGLESPGILLKVLESPGILNSEKRDCKNDVFRV